MKLFILLRHQQRGIGLPEVMITLLLLSTASLSLTQLQLKNLQFAYQSHQDTRQALIHGEAIERMWQQRCYLGKMDESARTNYLTLTFPDLFSQDATDPLASTQVWESFKPSVQGC